MSFHQLEYELAIKRVVELETMVEEAEARGEEIERLTMEALDAMRECVGEASDEVRSAADAIWTEVVAALQPISYGPALAAEAS